MTITLGFSPCPNDTFIFDALVNHKIDTGGLVFEVLLEDVQTLNRLALEGRLAVTKISYGVLPLLLDRYVVLNSGSALGSGVGPLLITTEGNSHANIDDTLVAIPGENTTAHLLFSLAYPHASNKIFLRYDEIEQYVADGKGPGVIIHENRFTYKSKGLEKIADLGDYWEKITGHAIPLGGIVGSRQMDHALCLKVDALIKKSIEYGFANLPELNDYIRRHAQEMSEDVMRKHIALYVNQYSLKLGEAGKKAIIKLMEVYGQLNPIAIDYKNIFLDQSLQ